MSTSPLLIAALVAALAVVQSLFGVGLLLFGTPLLLLLGLPFPDVLGYLLPCSIAVSALQVATSGGSLLEPIRRRFLAFAVPAVIVGTAVALMAGTPRQIKLLVGILLIVTAAIRFGPLRSVLETRIRDHIRPMMVGLGLLHGLSNLGGGILTVVVGSTFTSKVDVRRHIAFAYGAMAIMQLTVVLFTGKAHLNVLLWLCLPALAAGMFLVIGQRAFRALSQGVFQVGLTAVIASFGLVLVSTA